MKNELKYEKEEVCRLKHLLRLASKEKRHRSVYPRRTEDKWDLFSNEQMKIQALSLVFGIRGLFVGKMRHRLVYLRILLAIEGTEYDIFEQKRES